MQIRTEKTGVFACITFIVIGAQLSCTSVFYNQQAQADIVFMEKYEKRSRELSNEIDRLNGLIAKDTANSDLVARRESLIIRKFDVDKIREQARKSAIENAEKGQRSSPLRRSN